MGQALGTAVCLVATSLLLQQPADLVRVGIYWIITVYYQHAASVDNQAAALDELFK